jgi:hypothetical protein
MEEKLTPEMIAKASEIANKPSPQEERIIELSKQKNMNMDSVNDSIKFWQSIHTSIPVLVTVLQTESNIVLHWGNEYRKVYMEFLGNKEVHLKELSSFGLVTYNGKINNTFDGIHYDDHWYHYPNDGEDK